MAVGLTAVGWKLAMPGSNSFGVPGRIIVKGRNKMSSYDQKITDDNGEAVIAWVQKLCK